MANARPIFVLALFCARGAASGGFSTAGGDGFFLQNKIAHHQDVHLRALKTIESFFGAADDGLVVVERSIQHDRNTGEITEGANKFPVQRVRRAADGLQARGSVHMRGRGDHGAFFRTHVVSESHERRRMSFLEKLAGGFLENGGREGTESFAMFDAAIQHVFHFGAARIGENAALAKRARAPFDAALKPAEDFALGDVARGDAQQSSFIEVLGDLHVVTARREFLHGGANLHRRKLRAPSGVVHHEFARAAEDLVIHGERSADGKTSVARGRLNINALERRVIEYFSVGDAIKSHAAREAERFFAGFFGEGAPVRGENFFERGLHAGREIVVALLERLVGEARGAEAFFEIRRKKPAENGSAVGITPGHVRALRLVREIFQAQAEGKRRVHVNDAAKFFEEFRLAVGSEAHHFVFVAKFPEADVLRERGVIHAERMRERDFAERLHARTFAERPHGTGEIAEAVGGKDGAAFKGRDEISAGEMRGVMFDAMESRADFFRRSFEGCGEVFVNSGEAFHHASAIESEFGHAHCETQFGAQARPGIARDGDVIHFGEFHARLIQAILDRAHGEAGRVFHAVEALFFDGGEQASVGDNRGGGVGVVRVDAQYDHHEYCGGNLPRCLTNKLQNRAMT